MLKISSIIITANLLLLGGQFWLTSIYSVSGREISEVLTQISDVKSENNQLQLAIWKKSSLSSIHESAANLSFVPITPTVLAPLTTAQVP
ncbi:hypothetical protein HYS82_02700 [Candidatus Amesbacteria bacterium]|nr:hypothetical protein [Candidatus Amesbacteria bacterium]